MAEISPLRRRMIEDMTVRNLSPATQQSYLNAVSKFSRYFGCSLSAWKMSTRSRFIWLQRGSHGPALNQIVCALRFFYGVTLGQDTVPERIAYARKPSKLPVVLSADEVVRFLEAIPSLKSRSRRTARVGSRSLKDRRHRQPADGDPGRAGQGRQGPLRHALSAAPEDFTHLLAARSTEAMAVSRS
jgi:hypothetical protein